ncbi:leukotriene B4 receptor 1-like [Scleropages formosus]|uniref:Leukotriene B4 receptor 1-like n=1 Tax=Scleropages formosus TaxID=113540 RepID=A0A0P7XHX2_SCLFO|nr:leukotriene B4 receptor 1-like [Scleropages formosus]KPP74765.1 leukotriene B4 receptor 1-like [Scleropages formosus]
MNGTSTLPSKEMEAFDGGSVAACVILSISFLVGTPGNILVIWTILQHVKKRSHTVMLILHLAIADLLVLITLPLWIFSFIHSWLFGEAVCKAMVYIVNSCMYASVFLITLMSMERFIAVRHPFACVSWKKRNLLNKVLLPLWISAFLLSIPVIPTQILDDEEQCLSRNYTSVSQEVVCLLLETLLGFVIPFSIMVICYSCLWSRITQMTFKSKQNPMVLIISIVVLFALCWIPHHVGNILSLVALIIENSSSYSDLMQSLESARENMAFATGALVFISSTVNPILYVFAARTFRSSLWESGMLKLFRHISSSATGEGTKELSFVSKRHSSQCEPSACSTDPKVFVDIDIGENAFS